MVIPNVNSKKWRCQLLYKEPRSVLLKQGAEKAKLGNTFSFQQLFFNEKRCA